MPEETIDADSSGSSLELEMQTPRHWRETLSSGPLQPDNDDSTYMFPPAPSKYSCRTDRYWNKCFILVCVLCAVAVVWAFVSSLVVDTLYTRDDWLQFDAVQARGFSPQNDTLVLIGIPYAYGDVITQALSDEEADNASVFRRPESTDPLQNTTYVSHGACPNYGTAHYILHPGNFDCRGPHYTTRMAARCLARLACPTDRPVFGFGVMLHDPVDRFLAEFEAAYGGLDQDTDHPVLARDMRLDDEDYYCNGTRRDPQPSCADQAAEDVGDPKSPARFAQLDQYLACVDNAAVNRQARHLAARVLRHADALVGNPTTLYEEAKWAVDTSLWLGLSDQMRVSAHALQELTGAPFSIPAQPTLPALPSYVTPDQLRKILFLNAIDVELYNHARKVFETRYA